MALIGLPKVRFFTTERLDVKQCFKQQRLVKLANLE